MMVTRKNIKNNEDKWTQDVISNAKVDGYIYPIELDRKEMRARQIIKCLMKDFRMTLTEMSREIKSPVSTIYDNIKELRGFYDFKVVLVRKKQGGN